MTQLNLQDIYKLSDLSKIEISEKEAESFLQDINGILKHVSLIENLNKNNENVEDSKNYFDNIFREDNFLNQNFDREILLKNISDLSDENYVRIHKVINK